jgi:hypothetical protein
MQALRPYYAPDDKRLCPIGGKNCYAATFDSYRQMLAHCRQKHPERRPLQGEHTPTLIVTDTEGKVLSWEEMRQIIDNPLFWRELKEGLQPEGQREVSIFAFQPREELVIG